MKNKSAEPAGDAVAAAKRRPGTVAFVLGGLALFLARKPIGKRAVAGCSRGERRKAATKTKLEG